MAQGANARMQQQGSGGAIVNIGSVAARRAEPGSERGRRTTQVPIPVADLLERRAVTHAVSRAGPGGAQVLRPAIM